MKIDILDYPNQEEEEEKEKKSTSGFAQDSSALF